MTRPRLLPAHVVVIAAVVGLAWANAFRLSSGPALLLVGASVGGAAASRATLIPVALAVLVVGWWWGSYRLDTLDRSPMSAEIDRAGRARLEITGPTRHGQFALRIPARIESFDARPLRERVQLELPLGRAPPQGAIIDALVVVDEPAGPRHGFDERTWLRRQGIHVVLHVDEWQVLGRRGGIGGVADRLRGWLARASGRGLQGQRRAVVEGVLLGDDDALSPGLKTAFRRSGLYHLLGWGV